jgi:hypothetical protein
MSKERIPMALQPTPTLATQAAPWQEKRLGYGLKLLVLFGFVLLIMAAVVSGITLIGLLISLATVGGTWTGDFWSDEFPFLLLIVIVAVSAFGIVKLYPYVSSPSRFKPTYDQVMPDTLGQPFENRYSQRGLSRSFRGKGTVRFEAEQLVLDGTLAPSALFQLGVVVVVTLLPLLLLGIGLGLIPALLIAFLLGKKKVVRAVPYGAMRDLTLKGCQVSFSCTGAAPNKVAFYVAEQDGERLYRELAQRFPTVLGGWMV